MVSLEVRGFAAPVRAIATVGVSEATSVNVTACVVSVLLPATSVKPTLKVCAPSGSAVGGVNVQVPSGCTVVVPSSTNTGVPLTMRVSKIVTSSPGIAPWPLI